MNSWLASGALSKVLRLRYALLAALTLVLLAANAGHGHGDWHLFAQPARALFGARNLHVYADNIDLVAGPVALAIIRALDAVGGYRAALVVFSAVGVLLVWRLECIASDRDTVRFVTLVGGAMFLVSWVDMVAYGHIDDALVCGFVVGAVVAIKARRPAFLGVCLGLAMASKPWAFTLAPLALALDARGRVRSLAIGAAVTLALWAPFILADTSSLSVGRDVFISRGSLPAFLDVGAVDTLIPQWWRPIELCFVTGVAALVARRRWEAVPLVAFALRVALDPSTWSYYAAPVLLGALVVDMIASRRAIPLWTFGAFLAFFVFRSSTVGDVVLAIRVAYAATAVVWSMQLTRRVPRVIADET